MVKKLLRKLKSRSGFTLGEALVTVLILLLVSTIVATGIPVAKNAYEKVVLASNSEVLLSTTVSALRNELGCAQDIKVNTEENTITYYNETLKSISEISRTDSDGIMIQTYQAYIADSEETASTRRVRLISEEAATSNLLVTYSAVELDSNDVVTFTNLAVYRKTSNGLSSPLATRATLSIRILSE